VKCNNISLTSTEIEELKKTRQVYLTKKFSNSIKFENNKFKINIFELMKLESFKTTLSYILRNFVNYNSKFLFNDYIETSREKDTDKVKNSVKLHELLFSSEQNVYSYNLLRNLTFLNELRETFVSNETNENLKNELKKSSVLLLNKDILSLKYDVNKSKERKLFKKDYSQIKIVNNDEVEKLKELNVFEQINVQMNEMFNIENMSECFNIK
jgi:hypothetical protein